MPIIKADDLTPAQIKAYRIADNKVSEYATWNNELLSIELEGLQELEFDLDLTGFEDWELDNLINGDSLNENEEQNTKERNSVNLNESISVVVECDSDEQAETLFMELSKEGYSCRISTL